MAVVCKKCGGEKTVFNGKVRGKQRYLCKDCKYNFAENDMRHNNSDEDIAKRSPAVLLYSMCKASYNFLGTKLFKVSPTTIMNWIKKYANSVETPEISGNIKEIEFDEMWHFINSKKRKNGYSKRLIVGQGKLSPTLSAIVILQHLDDCTTN
jgi:transposase-like protein